MIAWLPAGQQLACRRAAVRGRRARLGVLVVGAAKVGPRAAASDLILERVGGAAKVGLRAAASELILARVGGRLVRHAELSLAQLERHHEPEQGRVQAWQETQLFVDCQRTSSSSAQKKDEREVFFEAAQKN